MERQKSRRSRRSAQGRQKKAWYVISYRYSKHRKIVKALEDVDVKVYCPLRVVWRKQRRGARKRVEFALLPGYLFVAFDQRQWRSILSIDGVRGFLGFGQTVAACRAEEIEGMMQRERDGLYDETLQQLAKFVVGQKVTVGDSGYVGEIVEFDEEWVTINVPILGKVAPMTVGIDNVS